MNDKAEHWAVIPAAGVGKRMRSHIPKQYLPLAEKTVIEITLSHFIAHPKIKGIVVSLSADDEYWPELSIESTKPLLIAAGGEERCHSVLNALVKVAEQASDSDWVLVHDAARPCLSQEDISRLIDTASGHKYGGLLGIPVRDTIKRTDHGDEVEATVDREGLWHALTPQMFRLNELRSAIEAALENNQLVTDDASAMELAGKKPIMVEGSAHNLKITRPEDLVLAEFYIRRGMADNQLQPSISELDGLSADEG